MLSEETKALCEKRRSLRKKVINSKESHAATIQEYRKVNRIVKKDVKKAKRIQLDGKIRKLEDDFRKNDLHNLLKSVRELERKPIKSLMVIKNQNADKRTQTDEVFKIWEEHFEQHLNTKFLHKESILQSIPETMPGTEQSTEELIISQEETTKAISLPKNNKAPGSEFITAEVQREVGDPIVNMLHLIFLKIVNEENTPLNFSKMLATPIFKKGDKCPPKNHRAISLLSIPGKVLNKILSNKIREKQKYTLVADNMGSDLIEAQFLQNLL